MYVGLTVKLFFAAGTRALSYAEGSFTQYLFLLHKFHYDPRETKIHMQIRTRDPDGGVLMFNAGSEEGRFSSLEVICATHILFLQNNFYKTIFLTCLANRRRFCVLPVTVLIPKLKKSQLANHNKQKHSTGGAKRWKSVNQVRIVFEISPDWFRK